MGGANSNSAARAIADGAAKKDGNDPISFSIGNINAGRLIGFFQSDRVKFNKPKRKSMDVDDIDFIICATRLDCARQE